MNREEKNQEATIYIGNLDDKVTDSILFELCLQAGPVVHIHIPRDRIRATHNGFGFCDAQPGQTLRQGDSRQQVEPSKNTQSVIGANVFVGNLDTLVDEKVLFDTFSAFGQMVQPPQVVRDDSGKSKGYGFVFFDSFEAGDAAIEAMNNHFFMNKTITVSYAYKREGKGDKHGDAAERKLAAAAKKNRVQTLPAGFAPAAAPVGAAAAAAAVSGGLPAANGAPAVPIPAPAVPPVMAGVYGVPPPFPVVPGMPMPPMAPGAMGGPPVPVPGAANPMVPPPPPPGTTRSRRR
ncbi:RNA-binding protein Sap49 [Schizosaccharomyces japonicus yFS275]|uniref:RNA-binding protein Sap49 n=1 Tax=Schizosaccharomyces japonicus (strain yFS275 / FY16936) TaxID=402676 RepID=B6JVT8_SCHJY|nr:RNA-binding protein Sap49 [Schizosaccharomyces japonicus yFS275]EEB05489.2 RNA-binding protein Sap49 [Schizosaccharomyces japonicus yFS275]